MKKFRERRNSRRLYERIPVLVKIRHGRKRTCDDQTTLLNFGAYGAYLLSRHKLSLGTRLMIHIVTSPGGEEGREITLVLRGRVILAEKAVAWDQGRILDGVAVKLDMKRFLAQPISADCSQLQPGNFTQTSNTSRSAGGYAHGESD